MLAFKFTNQEFACVNLVTPCLKATRRFIVTVRVSLFHSDVTVRLLDNLFVKPLKTSVYLFVKLIEVMSTGWWALMVLH